jgi:hypothetical protein
MIRSRLLLVWRARFPRREDPALRRISNLKGCGAEQPMTAVPVFFARKASLT